MFRDPAARSSPPTPAGGFTPTPKPWLQRRAGECAFPIGGRGEGLLSCAAPTVRGGYCAEHRRRMFRPADPQELRELRRLLAEGRADR